jgi:tRNA (mo5U34)-methyltransferase
MLLRRFRRSSSGSVTADPTERDPRLVEAERFYWYHSVELAPGVVTDGDYDMHEVLSHYGFPDAMAGMNVLDVGRASGFFAFEFERRGATVVATDIASLEEWDWVGDAEAREARLVAHANEEDHISGAFHFAKAARGSQVGEKTINVYDLDPAEFEGRTFDVVFAGSIASHLRDPILAFEHLLSVTGGVCIVAAPSFDLPGTAGHALMSLVGTQAEDRRSWWSMNARGLEETLKSAGFREVEIVSHFTLRHRRQPLEVNHLVAHARP